MSTISYLARMLNVSTIEAEMILSLWGQHKRDELIERQIAVLPGLGRLAAQSDGVAFTLSAKAEKLLSS